MDGNRYRLITFDMDGTLLDSGKRILPDSIRAMDEAAAAGKIICLSTGRCMPEIQGYLSEAGSISYVIGASGGFIYDVYKGEYIYTNPIPPAIVLEMLSRVEGRDVQLVYMTEKAYTQRDCVPRMPEFNVEEFQALYETSYILPEDMIAFYRADPFDCFKINVFNLSVREQNEVAESYADLPLEVVYAGKTSLECTVKGATKGTGFRKLCELLGIPVAQTIAVGDSDNDLPVLNEAGLSVAMGNSNANVLRTCDVTVADNDSGGCAEAIRRFLI